MTSRSVVEAYRALPSLTRIVALCYGVAYPLGLTRTNMVRALADADVRYGDRRLTQQQIKDATSELLRAGIAIRLENNTMGVVIDPAWALPMTIEAHNLRALGALSRALDAGSTHYYYSLSPGRLERSVRIAAVTGNFDTLRSSTDLPEYVWRFLAYDETMRLFDSIPEVHRKAARTACFSEAIAQMLPIEGVIALCQRNAEDAAHFAGEIAFMRILQGRFAEARETFDKLPDARRARKQVAVEHAATLALIATLEGDDVEAVRYLDQALQAEKAGTRKRNVFPVSRAFAFAILALVRVDTPAATARVTQLIKTAERDDVHHELVNFSRRALATRERRYYLYRESDWCGLEELIDGISRLWMGAVDLRGSRDPLTEMPKVLERAIANGFAWVAAEATCVIDSVNGANTEGAGAQMHAALGTCSLTNLLRPLAVWELAIKNLEVLAFETGRKAEGQKTRPTSTSQQRLAWELTLDRWGHITLTPRLQRVQKNGAWTKGSPVSPARLVSEPETVECLIAQDNAVIGAFRRDPYRAGSYDIDAPSVYELAGHPHVVNVTGAPVEVVRKDAELTIDETGEDELIARLTPDAQEGQRYWAAANGSNRVEVTKLGPSHERLREIIPSDGLILPRSARVRLMDAVTALAGELRIQSSVAGSTGSTALIDGDAVPWVQLVPAGEGLAVTVVVEPAAGSGQFFTPGRGGATVYAPDTSGQVVGVQRDLEAERSHLTALLAACPELPGLLATEPLTLAEPAECLLLLEQLEQHGARCSWPSGQPFRIVARVGSSDMRVSIKSAADWFSASAEVIVDEKRVLGLKRLFELMDLGVGRRFLMLESGQFVALTDAFRKQLEELRSFSAPGKGESVRIHPLAAGLLDTSGVGLAFDTDKAWRAQCDRFRTAQTIQAEVPSTLQAELRPYQIEGFQWLVQLCASGAGACLADDMGLGKTVQALAVLLHRATEGPAIIIAPTSVASNWIKEARRFAPTLNMIAYSGDRSVRSSLIESVGAFDVVVTTYGLLHNDIDTLGSVHWASAVLDEAQAIKNLATQRARSTFALQADFRLVTTGTPIQNNLMDLFSLFRFINPGLLGTAAEFRRRYQMPIERDDNAHARTQLNRLIAPFVLRRLKSAVLDDLPSRTEITLEVDLSPAEAAFYEALRQRAVDDLASAAKKDPGERHIEVLAHLTRLRLACCNPRLVQSEGAPASSKLAMFAETLDELLANRHKVLVFSQFVRHLKLVEEHLLQAGVSYQYLDGQTPAKTRDKRIDAFQAGEGDVFLISLKAGGMGLNLTAADYVIHLDPWWNPAVEDQASDRAHRIGQTRPVTIYRLVTRGTIEEQIVDLHRHKRDLADQLLEGTSAPARLDVDALLELLKA